VAEQEEGTIYPLRQVFVVGQPPTLTYSPRESKRLEVILNDYLDERGRILVVTARQSRERPFFCAARFPAHFGFLAATSTRSTDSGGV
jgi:hypothetical protein